jgi:hypothetical protein
MGALPRGGRREDQPRQNERLRRVVGDELQDVVERAEAALARARAPREMREHGEEADAGGIRLADLAHRHLARVGVLFGIDEEPKWQPRLAVHDQLGHALAHHDPRFGQPRQSLVGQRAVGRRRGLGRARRRFGGRFGLADAARAPRLRRVGVLRCRRRRVHRGSGRLGCGGRGRGRRPAAGSPPSAAVSAAAAFRPRPPRVRRGFAAAGSAGALPAPPPPEPRRQARPAPPRRPPAPVPRPPWRGVGGSVSASREPPPPAAPRPAPDRERVWSTLPPPWASPPGPPAAPSAPRASAPGLPAVDAFRLGAAARRRFGAAVASAGSPAAGLTSAAAGRRDRGRRAERCRERRGWRRERCRRRRVDRRRARWLPARRQRFAFGACGGYSC